MASVLRASTRAGLSASAATSRTAGKMLFTQRHPLAAAPKHIKHFVTVISPRASCRGSSIKFLAQTSFTPSSRLYQSSSATATADDAGTGTGSGGKGGHEQGKKQGQQQQQQQQQQQSWFKRMWDSPIGIKTVHFWAPVMKWALVIAGISDLTRPADKLSFTQNAALTATGLIWTRWCLIIKPKNYLLAAVNFFLAIVGIVQVSRIMLHQRSQESLPAAAEDKVRAALPS